MKKLLLIALAVFVCSGASAQRRNATADARIEFEKTEHQFGKVPENGKKVTCYFDFTNTGTTPLIITRITTTCKCVDYSFSKKPIPPGGKGQIAVTYNPKKQEGVFYKVIQVYANTEDPRHLITVSGEVIK